MTLKVATGFSPFQPVDELSVNNPDFVRSVQAIVAALPSGSSDLRHPAAFTYTVGTSLAPISLPAGIHVLQVDPRWSVSEGGEAGLLMTKNVRPGVASHPIAAIQAQITSKYRLQDVGAMAVQMPHAPLSHYILVQPVARQDVGMAWTPVGDLITIANSPNTSSLTPFADIAGDHSLLLRVVGTAMMYINGSDINASHSAWAAASMQPNLTDLTQSLTALKIVGFSARIPLATPAALPNANVSGSASVVYSSAQMKENGGYGGAPKPLTIANTALYASSECVKWFPYSF